MTIALITGGSRGLGRSMALHMADRGQDIILTYHSSKDAAEDVVAEIEKKGRKAVALQFDVADHDYFDAFIASLKETLQKVWQADTLDILINNAGTGLHKPFAETNEEEFDRMVAEHLKAPFLLTTKVIPMLNDGGHIVNISSGLARFAIPGYSVYAMMKGGLEVMARYLAKELGDRQIKVNAFAPGAIETDFGGGAVRDNKELNDYVSSVTALGRPGKPDDIGAAVASLVSGDMDWVTGQRLEASGGMLL